MSTLPAVPPILDADRVIFLSVTSPTSVIPVTFPVFGAQEDLQVIVNFAVLDPSLWTFTSASGTSLSLLPLPITDGQVTLLTPVSSGTIEIIGNWQPRQVIQPSAPGIARREFNQVNSTIIASLREVARALKITPNFVQTDALGNGFYNAFNHLLSNVADPQSGQDAVNLETLTSELSNFLTTGGIASLQSWSLTGNGATLVFSIPSATQIPANSLAYIVAVNGLVVDPSQYTINQTAKTITFTSAPVNSGAISVRLSGIARSITNLASTAQALAGADDTTFMSPLKSAQVLAAFLGNSPAFVSAVTGLTAALGNSSLLLATTQYVQRGKALTAATVYASGSGTFTTPAGCIALEVEMVGGGSGGGGSGTTTTGGAGGAGGDTTFGASLTAHGGAATPTSGVTTYATAATATGGDLNAPGALGQAPMQSGVESSGLHTVPAPGGMGAASAYGGGGSGGGQIINAGTTITIIPPSAGVAPGSGGGGPGALPGGNINTGRGGNAGAFLKAIIVSPLASYAYAVGAAGAGGAAGTGGAAGATGASGLIRIIARF